MRDLVQSVEIITNILRDGSGASKARIVSIALPEQALAVFNATEALSPIDVAVGENARLRRTTPTSLHRAAMAPVQRERH